MNDPDLSRFILQKLLPDSLGRRKRYALRYGTNSIGRQPSNDISIDDPEISDSHAIIKIFRSDTVYIIDQPGSQGVYKKRKKIIQKQLKVDDEFSFGPTATAVASNMYILKAIGNDDSDNTSDEEFISPFQRNSSPRVTPVNTKKQIVANTTTRASAIDIDNNTTPPTVLRHKTPATAPSRSPANANTNGQDQVYEHVLRAEHVQSLLSDVRQDVKSQHFKLIERNDQIQTLGVMLGNEYVDTFNLPEDTYSPLLELYVDQTINMKNKSMEECSTIEARLKKDIASLEVASSHQQHVLKDQSSEITRLYDKLYAIGWTSEDEWKKGAGIRNIGFTCYAGSALQALFHIAPLVHYLLKVEKELPPLTNSLIKLLKVVRAGTVVGDPTDFMGELRARTIVIKKDGTVDNLFPEGQECDSHEFLTKLMELLDIELKNESPFPAIFQFALMETITCPVLQCLHKSETLHLHRTLQLTINDDCELTNLIAQYLSTETLTDYKCRKCNNVVEPRKTSELIEPPPYLIIFLKRFISTVSTSENNTQLVDMEKNNAKVNIPINLSISTKTPERNNNYELLSMVRHIGSTLRSGHYLTQIRSPQKQTIVYNDHESTTMQKQIHVQPNEPFILFYRWIAPTTTATELTGNQTGDNEQTQQPAQDWNQLPHHKKMRYAKSIKKNLRKGMRSAGISKRKIRKPKHNGKRKKCKPFLTKHWLKINIINKEFPYVPADTNTMHHKQKIMPFTPMDTSTPRSAKSKTTPRSANSTSTTTANTYHITYHDVKLRNKDVTDLAKPDWLSGEVIDFFMAYMEYERFKDHPEIVFVQTYTSQLLRSDAANLDELLNRDFVSNKQLLLFPMSDQQADEAGGTHWFLVVFSMPDKNFYLFNSSYDASNYVEYNIQQFCDRLLELLELDTQTNFSAAKCLRQTDTYQCAVHVMCNVENIANHFVQQRTCVGLREITTAEVDGKRQSLLDLIRDIEVGNNTTQLSPITPNQTTNVNTADPNAEHRKHKTSNKSSKSKKSVNNDGAKRKRRNKSSKSKKTASVAAETVVEPKKQRRKPAGKTTQFKRQKGVKPEDQPDQCNFTTTKLKLRTILKHQENNNTATGITKTITELSVKATKIASLASMLLLAKVDKFLNNNHFFSSPAADVVTDCFFEVLNPHKKRQGKQRTQKLPQYELPSFAGLMREQHIERPNNNSMGNMFKYMNQLYFSNFKTNITTHGKARIMGFFKTFDDVTKRDRKRTIEYLFWSEGKQQPNQLLLDRLQALDGRYDDFVRGSLANYKDDWFWYVPLFVRIQRHVYTYNMRWAEEWRQQDEDQRYDRKKYKKSNKKKNKDDHPKHTHLRVNPMTIVPLSKYKRQHLRIDTNGLFHILSALKWLPKQQNKPNLNITETQFRKNGFEHWNRYFDMAHIDRIRAKNKNTKLRFSLQIVTDGESASLLFEAPLTQEVDNAKRLQRIRAKDENGDYKYQIGVDLGYNTYMAAVRVNKETKTEFLYKLKSKQFHRSTKNSVRKKKFTQLAGNYENLAATHRESLPEIPTPTGSDVTAYIRHRLKFWDLGIRIYTQQSYAKMAFDKYTNTQVAIDKMVLTMTRKSPSLFLIGGVDFSPKSPIKGHVRCPGLRKLVKALKKYFDCDIVFVDEYNTSQHCGRCLGKFERSTKKFRFKQCTDCPGSTHLPDPTTILTKQSKRYMSKAKKIQPDVPVPIKRVCSPVVNSNRTIVWQRDITAARLIWYKGTRALHDQDLAAQLVRPVKKNGDEESGDEESGDEESGDEESGDEENGSNDINSEYDQMPTPVIW